MLRSGAVPSNVSLLLISWFIRLGRDGQGNQLMTRKRHIPEQIVRESWNANVTYDSRRDQTAAKQALEVSDAWRAHRHSLF